MKIRSFLSDEVKSLSNKSSNIVDVFTKTVNKLTTVNEQASKAISRREEEMSKLEGEKVALGAMVASNEKVITKLNSILKD
jgi:hypothetical protein